MQLKWSLFFVLVFKPLVIVALSMSFNPSSGPDQLPGPKERQELYHQWVKQIFDQHHQLTDLKLIYTRLPSHQRLPYNRPLNELQEYYQSAVATLEKLKETKTQQWRTLARVLQEISQQIEKEQNQLEQKLMTLIPNELYRI